MIEEYKKTCIVVPNIVTSFPPVQSQEIPKCNVQFCALNCKGYAVNSCNTVNSMIYVHKTRKEADGKRGETDRMKPAPKLLSAVSAIALALTPALGGGIVATLATASAAEAAASTSPDMI